MLKRAGFLLLLCVASAARADRVDDYLRGAIHSHHIPGLAVAVVRDGRVVKSAAYGWANLELRVPVTTSTVFEIGSVTKQFTSMAVMMLVEEGKVSLDAPVSTYLANVPEAWKGMTVRHLLTHTSGIQDYLGVPEVRDAINHDTSHDRIAELFFSGLRLDFPPGETWSYSNSAYLLLGNIIEKASGKPYFTFIEERIFRPLSMKASGSSAPRTVLPQRASGYEWRNDRFENRPALGEDAYAAGAIVSTVGDLAKWDSALRERKLLKKASFDAIWTPARASGNAVAPFDYGFGWFLSTYHGRRVFSHTGGTPGFSSALFRFVDDGLTVILLTNHTDRVLDHLAVDVAGMYVPALARPATDANPDPATTERMRRALESVVARNPDPASFTPAMARFLQTGVGREVWAWSASDGPLRSFTFSESERVGDLRIVRYRTRMGNVTRWYSFTLTSDGRIAQIQWW